MTMNENKQLRDNLRQVLAYCDELGYELGFAGVEAKQALEHRDKQAEPVALGGEWIPCMKLPVVVHVRKQREGEKHVSTREGITPVKPDDLIMRGVSGEEYPIGLEIFEQTYSTDLTHPAQPVQPAGAQRGPVRFEVISDGKTHQVFQDETKAQDYAGNLNKSHPDIVSNARVRPLYPAPPAAAINEQAQRDAERYRWLRDKSVPPHNFYLSVPVEFDGVKYTPQEVDSYIDAAIVEAEKARGRG